MLYYVPKTVSKSTCIGNSLSTINIGFSSLDTNLEKLSAYAVSSINFLSATMISVSSNLQNQINYLSSTMISVSSNLQNQVNYLSASIVNLKNEVDYLSSSINYLSAHTVTDWFTQHTITHEPSGKILWDVATTGPNVNLILSSNCWFKNPTNLLSGQEGNITVTSSGVSGYSISAYENKFAFNGSTSTNENPNGKNLIHYYYDGSQLLCKLSQY